MAFKVPGKVNYDAEGNVPRMSRHAAKGRHRLANPPSETMGDGAGSKRRTSPRATGLTVQRGRRKTPTQ